jgi:hypothetical protein
MLPRAYSDFTVGPRTRRVGLEADNQTVRHDVQAHGKFLMDLQDFRDLAASLNLHAASWLEPCF